jgi:1-acyl-sn-glycerol-3-phosphate acyltransferase
MRTIPALIATFFASCFFAPLVLCAKLIGIPHRFGSIYERSMRGWAKSVLFAAGVKVRVHGAEHMAQTEGAVYIINHVSWFDVFAMAAVLPRCTFVAKAELRRIPIFGQGAEAAGMVFLDRANRKSAFEAYKSAAVEVSRGRSIVVCPEGTRGSDYHLRPFKKGPFVLAIAAQAKVIPAVVYGALEVMPKGTFRIRSGEVDVHVLPPVSTVGLAYEDRAALVSTVWHQMAEAMEREFGVESRGAAVSGGGEESGERE